MIYRFVAEVSVRESVQVLYHALNNSTAISKMHVEIARKRTWGHVNKEFRDIIRSIFSNASRRAARLSPIATSHFLASKNHPGGWTRGKPHCFLLSLYLHVQKQNNTVFLSIS